ncbi:hypothetical protein CD797_16725 [Pseudomonas aeruginosa]|uniref:hypothetical protein n=1 Tax=Pseudomonas aeruginosa TaxID=287 RepID=UPI000B4CF37C|nr:hypothetical protein [Pseudomonas aeruginosa]ASD04086.1 hypothetical protein CD797_16725 [Pseudomonas aeruginosa]
MQRIFGLDRIKLLSEAWPELTTDSILEQITSLQVVILNRLTIQQLLAFFSQPTGTISQPAVTHSLSQYQLDQVDMQPGQLGDRLSCVTCARINPSTARWNRFN